MAYLVVDQFVSVNGSDCRTFYCDSIAEARRVLSERWQAWQVGDKAAYLTLYNGFKPSNLPAAFVATNTRRYGRCLVARRNLSGGRAELGIIAL